MKLIKIPGVNNGFDVPVQEIIRVEAISNYSRIYFSNGKVMVVAKVLRWFEEALPVDIFARVHRSHLVNRMFVKHIKGIHTKEVLLYNGECIAISRRRKSLMKIVNDPFAVNNYRTITTRPVV